MARLTKEQLQKEVEYLRKENIRLRGEIQGIRDGLRSIRIPVDERKSKTFNFYVLAVIACIFFLALFLFTPKQDKTPSTATKVVLATNSVNLSEPEEEKKRKLEALAKISKGLQILENYPVCDYKFRDGVGQIIRVAKAHYLSSTEYEKLDQAFTYLQSEKNCTKIKSIYM